MNHAIQVLRLHPCVRDIWHEHLLLTGNELTGLIDPAANFITGNIL